MKNPKISVVIPLYNHEAFIERCIISIIEQSYQDYELIIINDGSTDNSENIVKKITDRRIRYCYQQNQGAFATINKGIKLSKGTYISILNSDDTYSEHRLKRFIEMMCGDSSLEAIFSYIKIIDEHDNLIRLKKGPEDNWKTTAAVSFKEDYNKVYDLLAGNYLLTTSNIFCKKDIFERIGYFRKLKYTHDYDMFLRINFNCKTKIVDDYLINYRMHRGNTFKKDRATVRFEVGLLLTEFLLKNNIYDAFKMNYKNKKYKFITQLYNSLNTYNTDKMVMILLLMSSYDKNFAENYFNDLLSDNNCFKKNVLSDYIKSIN